jgi:hypothetical protein
MGIDAVALFDEAMSLNADGFAAGHYEAAYHALMTAMYLARDLADGERLRRVARLAEEQGRQIDSLTPAHRLSSWMTKTHTHEGVFQRATRQALMQARLIKAKDQPDPHSRPKKDIGLTPGTSA